MCRSLKKKRKILFALLLSCSFALRSNSMTKQELDAEWESLTIEHASLKRDQQELEHASYDKAMHEAHRRRLHAHIDRLHGYHGRLRAWHDELERQHAEAKTRRTGDSS